MRKRTIVIIISFISAFILMSGGYGFWQKPLIITGKIKVIELPKPAISAVAPVNTEMLDSKQSATVAPEIPNNPEENVGIVPNEQIGVEADSSREINTEEIEPTDVIEAADNVQSTGSAPVDQLIDDQETGNTDNTTNQEQEQDESKTVAEETTTLDSNSGIEEMNELK